MFLNTLSGHLEIIRRHPALAAELAGRFTEAPLPPPADQTVALRHVNMSVRTGDTYSRAVEVAVYDTPRPGAAARARALAVTVLDEHGFCRLRYRAGENGQEVISPVALGPDSGPELAGGSPWLTVFAAVLGAVDLLKEDERGRVLAAIDAAGCGAAGICALSTEVMRKAAKRAREKLEADMGTGPLKSDLFGHVVDTAYAEGYALGLQEGRTAASILKVLGVRGIPVTTEQADRISACQDLERLNHWLGRAVTAVSAADVLDG